MRIEVKAMIYLLAVLILCIFLVYNQFYIEKHPYEIRVITLVESCSTIKISVGAYERNKASTFLYTIYETDTIISVETSKDIISDFINRKKAIAGSIISSTLECETKMSEKLSEVKKLSR